MKQLYYPQIDLMKCLAIILIIVLHTVPTKVLGLTYADFHIWQAVPVFLVIMGITSVISYERLSYTRLGEYYSLKNMVHRCRRILVPFAIVFMVSIVFGIVRHFNYLGWGSLLGVLPIPPAPGNYYLSILFQFLIFVPLIMYFFRKNMFGCILFMVGANLAFEYLVSRMNLADTYFYYYLICLLRWMANIAVGMYIGKELVKKGYIDILGKHNRLLRVGILLSILYLVVMVFTQFRLPISVEWMGTQNLLSVGYPLLLVSLMLNVKIDNFAKSFSGRILTTIGKASYHIFLVQMLYFGLEYGHYGWDVISGIESLVINITITVVMGVAFYYLDNVFLRRVLDGIGKLMRQRIFEWARIY